MAGFQAKCITAWAGQPGLFWSTLSRPPGTNGLKKRCPVALRGLPADRCYLKGHAMGETSVGQNDPSDSNENKVKKGAPPAKTFGEEGTNKTQPRPDPNATPSDVGSGKFIEPTPFTR
jgi:hypothetical protein